MTRFVILVKMGHWNFLRDRCYWPDIQDGVISFLYLKQKLHNHSNLFILDYLQTQPSKGNIENVLIVIDHFTMYAQAFPSKTQTSIATAKLLWHNFILHYCFPSKIISEQSTILKVSYCKSMLTCRSPENQD